VGTFDEQHWGFSISGIIGLWVGLTGPILFPVVMALFGWLFAKLEWWTMRKATTARMVTLALLLVGALFYERGIPSLLVFLRFAIPLNRIAWYAQQHMPSLVSPTRDPTRPVVSGWWGAVGSGMPRHRPPQ
jgi:hypothetical protein